jgi:hypothetical protein
VVSGASTFVVDSDSGSPFSSFLPQDKVSSFAHMTPQQLLVETQKAAGDPNLSSWFETLKDEGKQLKLAQQVRGSWR